MKLRHSRQEAPDVDITPLIDVVFLLLIFFMVSTTFKRESEIAIELPQVVSGKEVENRNKEIEIVIDAEGRYYVNDMAVLNTRLSTLVSALQKVAGSAKEPRLIISADAKAPYQSVMSAMDAAQQLGFNRLTFATEKTP
ncbi:MAG: biopolymer transporter ExbD [Gammaproteobacteria bacterium]|nr:MAG: biopolymer transporter ExbD [Gammaproteobacteria bacterium]